MKILSQGKKYQESLLEKVKNCHLQLLVIISTIIDGLDLVNLIKPFTAHLQKQDLKRH